MALIVQKYGGTSVGSPERIKNVVTALPNSKQLVDVVVVVSAMSAKPTAWWLWLKPCKSIQIRARWT